MRDGGGWLAQRLGVTRPAAAACRPSPPTSHLHASIQLCKDCFYGALEAEVHDTITTCRLFSPGERVAIAASGAWLGGRGAALWPAAEPATHPTSFSQPACSGGKDSTVLAHVLTTLNEQHGYGLDLRLLSIDEGIAGYRDDSLATVVRNEAQYGIPLTILSYRELYGWTMDEIVAAVGHRGNCTFCGVFRRQALDRGGQLLGADKVATGE